MPVACALWGDHGLEGTTMQTRWRFLISLLVLLAGLVAVSGCDITGGTTVHGSGHVKSESRPVSGFTQVEFAGVGHLTLAQVGTETLNIQADDNLLPLLTSTVSGGVLHLQQAANTTITSATAINYILTVKSLTGFSLSGAGDAEIANLSTSAMKVTVSGAGRLLVSGSAESQDVTISGVGSYDGSGFATKTAKVSLSGTGSAVVEVSDTLDAQVSGVGSVEYIGDPKVTQHVTGLGSVHKRAGP